jgi:translation initiation factor 4E
MSSDNFDLKSKWVLWFHKVNDNNWSIESYSKIFEINTYFDILFVVKEIENITSGMFFLMKEGVSPIFEDANNVNGGYWSMRITKKDAFTFWEKIIYNLCLETITNNDSLINGISVSPKINNCIFKIWNSNFEAMKKEDLRKDLDYINWEETFYLQHKGD